MRLCFCVRGVGSGDAALPPVTAPTPVLSLLSIRPPDYPPDDEPPGAHSDVRGALVGLVVRSWGVWMCAMLFFLYVPGCVMCASPLFLCSGDSGSHHLQ